MSGVLNVIMAPPLPSVGPSVHPVYSLDGLGANDPPVIPFAFGPTDTFVDFTYALPSDGNQHVRALCVICFAPRNTRVLTLRLNGNAVTFGFNSLAAGGNQQLFYGICFLDALTGSAWRLVRSNAVDGAVSGNLRIYTFGDADQVDSIFTPTNNVNLNTTPSPTMNSGTDADVGDCLFTIGTRNDWAVGRNYSVTNPLTYTYSPTGSAGVGLLTNGASASAALEFQFISVLLPTPSTTWTFTNVQPSEQGAVTMFNFKGASY